MISSPTRGMDPGVRRHGMKADPPVHIWSKHECFLMSGWWEILHSSCLHVKPWSNSTNGTEVRTNRKMKITHKFQGYNKHINGLEINLESIMVKFNHRFEAFNICCSSMSILMPSVNINGLHFASGINIDLRLLQMLYTSNPWLNLILLRF